MQSPVLLGRLSDTYINLAIGMGNRDKIYSGEGEVLLHALSPQGYSPNDIERCRGVVCQIMSEGKKRKNKNGLVCKDS